MVKLAMFPEWRAFIGRAEISRFSAATIFAVAAINFLFGGVANADTKQKIKNSVGYSSECGDTKFPLGYRLATKGDSTDIKIHSKSYWNASRLILESGVTYKFIPAENARWYDFDKSTDVAGWWPKGWMGWVTEAVRPLLRAPDQKFFQLMGMIYRSCAGGRRECAIQFPIGKAGVTFKPRASGEFRAYANDLPFAYGNNSGEITLRITRK